MSFMQPEVFKGKGYAVESENGTDYVPSDVCGDLHIRGVHDEDSPRFAELCAAVRIYVEGRNIRSIEPVLGWWARLSAPGYLDCTPWGCYSTKREAMQSVRD